MTVTSFTARRRTRPALSWAEVLVIVLLVGTLVATVLPLYLGHPAAAKDAATEADAADLGVTVGLAFDGGDRITSLTTDDGWYVADGEPVLEISPGVELVDFTGRSADTWCIELRHPRGDRANDPGIRFSAGDVQAQQGSCAEAQQDAEADENAPVLADSAPPGSR